MLCWSPLRNVSLKYLHHNQHDWKCQENVTVLLASLSALPSVPDLWHGGRKEGTLKADWPLAETLNYSSWLARWPREKDRWPFISETMNPSLIRPSIQNNLHWALNHPESWPQTDSALKLGNWGHELMKGRFTKVRLRLKKINWGQWSWLTTGEVPFLGLKEHENGS